MLDTVTWVVVGFAIGGAFVVVIDWWMDQAKGKNEQNNFQTT